jgi:hypothetical protein
VPDNFASADKGLEQLALSGQALPVFTIPVREAIGTTPLRRASSVRRTMTIDVQWPDGKDGLGRYSGMCRDYFTGTAKSESKVLAEASFEAACSNREVRQISATPAPNKLQDLVGMRAGGHLRKALSVALLEEQHAASPLYLLLDDLAGATLVSGWSFSRWPNADPTFAASSVPARSMAGVCIGFRPGSSALDADGRARPSQNSTRVVPLANPDDPLGWHQLANYSGINFRRARRIDLWREGTALLVESHFQDSASAPDGGDRIAIHEYLVEARIGADGKLSELKARPGTLPFPDCRAAPVNLDALIGTPASDLRDTVLEKLSLTNGCTHLNDVVRSLAEVPRLADGLADEVSCA